MNGKINADLKSLKFILERNKPYMLPIVIIAVCVFLFLQFIIPQFKDLLIAQNEGREASSRLQKLKENLNVLINTNEDSLDSQLKILNLALPPNKDFTGILNAIYFASQKTGVGLGSFSLQIGDLSKAEKEDKFPTINLSVPLNADVHGVNSFVETINRTLPLSEAILIKIGDRTSIVSLRFYYKLLNVSNFSQDSSVIPLSQKAVSLINELSGFENTFSAPAQLELELPVATSSSEVNP